MVTAALVCGVMIVSVSPDAWAAGDQSQAAAAYEKGKGELRGGKLDAALATFRAGLEAPETDQLETWQLLLGAALAAEKLGAGSDSIEYYRRFLDASDFVYQNNPLQLLNHLFASWKTKFKKIVF